MRDEEMDFPIDEQLRGLADDYLAEAELPGPHIDRAFAQVSSKMGASSSAAGLSTGAKIGAALGVLTSVIAAAWMLTRPAEPTADTVAQASVLPTPKSNQPAPIVKAVVETAPEIAPESAPEMAAPSLPQPAPPADPSRVVPRADTPSKKTTPRASARAPSRKPTDGGDSSSTSATAKDELLLLQRARKAMRSGHPSTCLELLDEHESQFPKSRFGRERDATRVAALCKAEREDRARDAAKRYVERYGRERASFQPDDPCGT